MPWGRTMVDMARSTQEKVAAMESVPMAASDYPYGLCIRLDETDLEKLDLDDDVEAGDTIHLVAFAKVTSVRKTANEAGKTCCVELQITQLAVEDESTEAMPSKASRRYGGDEEADEG